MASTIPIGIARRTAPPIADAALGACGSITACRACVSTPESGLHITMSFHDSWGIFSIA